MLEKLNTKIDTFTDGQTLSKTQVSELSIEELCIQKKGEWSIAFVGIIILKTHTIISFPKHYSDNILVDSKNEKMLSENVTLLLNVLFKYHNNNGYFDSNNTISSSNFPLKDYLFICNYYTNHGLYKETESKITQGYMGNINWKKTIQSSQKIISNNNLLFLPFQINKKENIDVFITECMQFVLSDGYSRFGSLFKDIIKLPKLDFPYEIKNYEKVVQQLNQIKEFHFKDITVNLINSLINYFRWYAAYSNQSTLISTTFSNIWESMVSDYLNENFYGVSSDQLTMTFQKNCHNHNFKGITEYTESLVTRKNNSTNKFFVKYDHISEVNDTIYLFDSKYYKNLNELNYKQVAYHYFLSNNLKDKTIVNGLIIPSSEKYHSKIHLDRRDIDNLLITEHYFNVKEVMKSYIQN